MTPKKRGVLVLSLLLAALLLAILIPVWLIQPFRHQTPLALDVSYRLRQWSPIGVPILAVFVVVWGVRLWKGSGVVGRAGLATVCFVSLLAAWFSQQNYFEWMFRQPAKPEYVAADKASFLTDQDRVLGVELNGEAAAYPVRALAYHHLVQDRVGGEVIVATY